MFECTKCKILKNIDDFNSNVTRPRGHEYYCKECKNKYVRERKYHRRRKPRSKEWWREYYQKNRKKRIQSVKMSKLKYPEKVKARKEIEKSKKNGKVKTQPCIFCKNTKVEAHHGNYNEPLNVIWVCRKHHNMIHLQS